MSPLLLVSLAAFAAAGDEARPPNVVVILADDQGWGDLSLHGNTNLATPHIDSLARDGASFQRFFACPVCAPTRAEFLTGRYHPRGGVRGVTLGQERLNLDETTIADLFRRAGYATGCFGKWHNGSQYPYHPCGRGFDEFYGFTHGHWGHYFDPPLEHNGRPVRGRGFIVDDLTDRAIDFIGRHRGRPFFCYLPYNTPHSPFQVPERFYEKFRNHPLPLGGVAAGKEKESPEVTRCVLAMCENIDWNVGRLLARLDEWQLARRTIVVYFSDNGPNSVRYNGGMKGRKGSVDEGGLRVPCLVRWPGPIPAGRRVDSIAAAIDLLPTLASLAGVATAGTRPLDGVDLAPLLTGKTDQMPARMIFSHYNGKTSVRSVHYRLDAEGHLYDMLADPGQSRDVAGERPGAAAPLLAARAQWLQSVLPDGADQRPFPVGHKAFPATVLPARDGTPAGSIRRSGKAPNCSYFTDWRQTTDAVTWEVEVQTAGEYEALLHYACPAADVGATIELALGAARLRAKLAEPFDPPLWDGADRVPRKHGESYLKEFRPWPIGVLRLEKGRGSLVVRAAEIPGGQAMELWGVELRLK